MYQRVQKCSCILRKLPTAEAIERALEEAGGDASNDDQSAPSRQGRVRTMMVSLHASRELDSIVQPPLQVSDSAGHQPARLLWHGGVTGVVREQHCRHS